MDWRSLSLVGTNISISKAYDAIPPNTTLLCMFISFLASGELGVQDSIVDFCLSFFLDAYQEAVYVD